MIWLVVSALASVPWMAVRLLQAFGAAGGIDPVHAPYLVATLSGVAILGAAYLLSVGAEVAQLDISRSLALGFLALIAILPEYAVDMVFAWKGGADPSQIGFATANMTGANRLLIGLFWPVVVFVFAVKHKKDRVTLNQPFRLEVFFLLLATVYSFTIPLRGHISIVDFVLLGGVFVWYLVRASRAHHDEPEALEGPAGTIASWGKKRRRLMVLAMFLWAAIGIFAAAEPFAESLVDAGARLFAGALGAEEAKFLMVQWVAPLASEAPELVIATIFAVKAQPESALGALISSKVNQWTLLVGMLPLVFGISHAVHGGGFALAMPLDGRQVEEMFITSAQSLLATVLLLDLNLKVREAWLLLVLFLGQFFIPVESVRIGFAVAYLVISVVVLAASPEKRAATMRIVRMWRGESVSLR